MTAVVPPTDTQSERGTTVSRLTRWSLWMVPLFFLVFVVTDTFGTWVVLDWLDLNEGDLFLMAGGFAGWATEILFALVLVAAPVVGVWLAVSALRRGGRAGAWSGLVLNGLLIVLVGYLFLDAIHMTYYPGGGWLWF